MRALICTALLLFSFAQARANTLVIILRTEEATIIAADSKVRLTDDSDADPTCKIHSYRGITWVAAGMTSEDNGPFDVDSIARSAIDANIALEGIASEFNSVALNALRQVLFRVKNNPRIFDKITRVPDVLTVAFLKGTDVRIADFVLPDKNIPTGIQVNKYSCPGNGCPSPQPQEMFHALFGLHATAEAEMNRNSEVWKQKGLVGTLNYLMEIQTAATPEWVSPPVSILRIDKSGTLTWLQKGKCD